MGALHFVQLVQLAPNEASRGRPDTIRRPFPVISGASKCDGDCDDVRMRHTQTNTDTIKRQPVAFENISFWVGNPKPDRP